MKKTLLLFISLFILNKLHAQQFEISAGAYSGLFHYNGNGSISVSDINGGSPYGSKNGFSYGGDVQAQYISKSGFITGLQTGYQILSSKLDIEPTYDVLFYNINIQTPYQIPGKGQTYLQDQDINLNPYVGYRFGTKSIKLDITPGAELGLNINSYDKSKTTDDSGNKYQTNVKMPGAPTDIRLMLGIAAWFNRFGITASYAHGLTNLYKSTNDDGNYTAHSELIRFGISYRIF